MVMDAERFEDEVGRGLLVDSVIMMKVLFRVRSEGCATLGILYCV